MYNVYMINKKDLSKTGIGTWGIGGFMEVYPNNDDERQINSLAYTLAKGVNYIETVYMYAQGKAIDLLSQAVKDSKINREKIFITLSIYENDAKNINEVKERVFDFLKKFNTDYVDSVQFSMGLVKILGLDSVQKLIEDLIEKRKIRFTSLTNSNLEFLKQYHQIFGDKLFAHECVYNFEIRENEKLGITEYCKQNNILNIIFQPLRRNRTANRNWRILVELAKKYNKTQNQIILNWIVSKGFLPLIKSTSKSHINENLNSFDFTILEEDFDKLNNFVIPNYKFPKINWENNGEGIEIDQLPNVFDNIYPKNN